MSAGQTPYLSLCTIYRDDAAYLREWIEFHRLVGVERFIMYNNSSEDDHRAILEPYERAGIALVHDWPRSMGASTGHPGALRSAFEDCIKQHGSQSRWIGFIDVDEFLFSPTGTTVPELLVEYERWPGVCVSRAEFGSSGHRHKPQGPVIESFVHRKRYLPDAVGFYKSIVEPTRTVRAMTVHQFEYRDGQFAVDENFRPVSTRLRPSRSRVSFSRLRINHYAMKSDEERERKAALWKKAGGRRGLLVQNRRGKFGELDEEITRYVPALREALKRSARAP
jgi:hypothetical protein